MKDFEVFLINIRQNILQKSSKNVHTFPLINIINKFINGIAFRWLDCYHHRARDSGDDFQLPNEIRDRRRLLMKLILHSSWSPNLSCNIIRQIHDRAAANFWLKNYRDETTLSEGREIDCLFMFLQKKKVERIHSLIRHDAHFLHVPELSQQIFIKSTSRATSEKE